MKPFLSFRWRLLAGALALATVLAPSFGQAKTPRGVRTTKVAATPQAVPATNPATPATIINDHIFTALNGQTPSKDLVVDGAGSIYGTTQGGGTNAAGTIFRVGPDGTITTLHNFGTAANSSGTSADGITPVAGLLLAPDGLLYGTTTQGGANNYGTVFSFNSANGALTTLASFAQDTTGYYCQAPLITDGNGNFYGVAQDGLNEGEGGIFVYNSAAGTLTGLGSFVYYVTGYAPQGGLLLAPDGNLYGTTSQYGPNVDNNNGTVYQFNPTTNTLTVIYAFDSGNSAAGAAPAGGLVTDGNGNFYGLTSGGGHGNGVVYELTEDTTATPPTFTESALYSFSNGNTDFTGYFPRGSLLLGTDGNLYGTTQNGGANNEGSVFRLVLTAPATAPGATTFGSITGLHDFAYTEGYSPNGTLATDAAGNLYGTFPYGSTQSGGVFELTATATAGQYGFADLYQFTAPDGISPTGGLTLGADGNLYGTTQYGGANNEGSVFVYNPTTGVTTRLYSFFYETFNGNTPVYDGNTPIGKLVAAANGVFYGTTQRGGANGNGFGTVYQLTTATDPATGAITATETTLYSFTASGNSNVPLGDGYYPIAGLTLALDGTYYGTTQNGGANNDGTVFQFNPATGAVTTLAAFGDNANGYAPTTPLVLAKNGSLYGVTQNGGVNGNGAVFQFNPATTNLTLVASFNSDDTTGYYPTGGLALGADGFLYGTTQYGGTNNDGTLFQVDPAMATSAITTLVAFNGLNGSNPASPLVQDADGNFYGTTQDGGANYDGTVFQYNPDTGAFATLADFGFGAGFNSQGGLTLTADGRLFGETSGGEEGGGDSFPDSLTASSETKAKGGKVHAAVKTNAKAQARKLARTNAATTAAATGSAPNAVGGPLAVTDPSGTIFEVVTTPTITSSATAVGTVGAAFSFQVTATSNPTAFTATGLPTGLTIAPATGVISGTPTATGTSSVTVTATNAGGSATQTLTIVVQPPTPPAVPVVTSGAPPAGQVGTAYGYQITASGTPTSYGASGLPAGLTINPTTGLVSGTPTAAGSYGVTILATNSGGTGTASFTLTILPLAPAITSAASANAVVGQAFSYQITATNGPTSFTATGLPPGLTSNSTAGLISGTPTTTGTSTVTISATNAGGTSTASLTLVVSNAPVTTPIISSAASASATAGTAFSYQIAASNNPTGYGATGLPTGLTVNTTTGLLSGTPTVPGSYTITLNATNAGGTGTGSLALTVTAAATPPTAPAITSPASASAQTGAAFTYQITASGNPTSFAATGLPAGLTVNPASGLISGTPTATGSFSVTLSATGPGGTGPATLTLTVTTTTVATPTISSPASASAQAGQAFSYQVTASNRPTGFTATGLPDGLAINTATGLISGTPVTTGAYTVGLSVTNAGGTSTANVALTVTSAAVVLPVISSAASAGGQVAVAFSYQITASNHPVFFGATGLPAGLSIDDATGVIAGTPTAAGIFTVNLLATNSAGSGTAALTLTIAAQPLPVVSIIASIPSVTLGTGQLAAFALTRTGGDSTQPLVVNYSVSGTATAGVDYLMLKGTKKFKADKTTVVINVTPEGTLNGAPKRTVKVTLLPGDGYTLGTATTAKAKIVAAP